MALYVVISYWGILDRVRFYILETDVQRHTTEFEALIDEEFEDNNNIVVVKELDEDFLDALRELNQKLNNIALKTPISRR